MINDPSVDAAGPHAAPARPGGWVALLSALLVLLMGGAPGRAEAARVLVVHFDDRPVVSASERFLTHRLDEAEAEGIPYLLVLDTPGGAVDTTRAIVRRFLSATVPVIVYVGPPGARAGSAGVFLTLAGHVAAMAPGTNIGAAHPIGAGVGAPPREDGEGAERSGRTEEEVLAEKIENDLVAFAEAIAKARGRNVEWAIQAVRDSASVPADRALELGVVDLLADDVPGLLDAIHGREVTVNGQTWVLDTAGAELLERPMSLRERVQIALGDPTVAYTLMSLGVLAIVLELYNPGMWIGAIVGGICIVLATASGLPFSAAGLLLLGAAGVLFLLEVYVTSFGLLSVAGALCLALGGLFLFETPPEMPSGDLPLEVGRGAIGGVALLGLIFGLSVSYLVVRALRRKPAGGEAGMIGQEGKALTDFVDGQGKVFLHGEYWNARSRHPVSAGQNVKVREIKGLLVEVEPTSPAPPTPVKES